MRRRITTRACASTQSTTLCLLDIMSTTFWRSQCDTNSLQKKQKMDDAWAAANAATSDEEPTESSFFDPLRDGVYRAVPAGPQGAKVLRASAYTWLDASFNAPTVEHSSAQMKNGAGMENCTYSMTG